MLNWIKQNWVKIGLGIVVLVVLFLVKGNGNNASNTALIDSIISTTSPTPFIDKPTPILTPYPFDKRDPLQVAGCEWDARVYYWDFTEEPDGLISKERGSSKRNFYITCSSTGTSGSISTYLFRNNQLLLKRESVYHGNAFMGKDGNFYVVEAQYGTANYCPKSYTLDRYTYNRGKEIMELLNTKKYLTYKIKAEDGWEMCYNTELSAFEKEMSIE